MRFLRFLSGLAGLIGMYWLLTTGLTIKGNTIPPLGNFFNPFSGFWQNAEPKIDPLSLSSVKLPGLKGEVSVVYDDLRVPHIFADHLADAHLVQGYITASERLFQMDISSRKSAGRLSEIVGSKTIPIDIATNHRGTPLAAKRAVEATTKHPESLAMMTAYTNGVNAFINRLTPDRYPVEYKLMDIKPEPWSIYHSACVIEGMGETLASKSEDVANSINLALLGKETYDLLFPKYNPDQTPVIPDDGQWKGIKPYNPAAHQVKTVGTSTDFGGLHLEGRKKDSILEPRLHPNMEGMVGSNNWAVSGSKTASGKPMLANDPHLNLTLPSIWFQVQIHTPEMNVYGVSLPGVPGVIIGFNEHIAWGVTNVSHDVGDFYKIKWTNSEKTKYLLDGVTKDADLHFVKINVKGQVDPVIDTVRYTDWGPVLTIDTSKVQCDLAFRWLPADAPVPNMMYEFISLNKAKNYDEYRRSIKVFDSPAQNFVFASRTGDIALTVQGNYPLRAQTTSEFVQDGSTSAAAWQGLIPADQIPFQKNPARGFVFSANQHSTPPSYPYPYYGYFDDYRGRMIHSRLTPMQGINKDSMSSIQLESRTQLVIDALPTMIALLDTNTLETASRLALQPLLDWDGRFSKDSKAAVLFDLWYERFYDLTFADFTKRAKTDELTVQPDTWRLNALMQIKDKKTEQHNHPIFDQKETPEVETPAQLCKTAYQEALASYALLIPQQKEQWGAYRGMTINHIARIPAFATTVNTDGHPNAPNANRNGNGPSWRMIVDLQDSIKGYGVFPGGQSGNPGSKHYDDMLNHWAEGKYYDLVFLTQADQTHERIRFTQKFTKQ
jgi:penicillin G amidase